MVIVPASSPEYTTETPAPSALRSRRSKSVPVVVVSPPNTRISSLSVVRTKVSSSAPPYRLSLPPLAISVSLRVIAKTAVEAVVSCSTLKRVICGTARQSIVTIAANQRVVVEPAVDGIVARAALQRILAISTVDCVIARIAHDGIVARPAEGRDRPETVLARKPRPENLLELTLSLSHTDNMAAAVVVVLYRATG